VGRHYLIAEGGEIARRRPLLPPGLLIEVWPDLHAPGEFWVGESAKALLDEAGAPLAARLTLDAAPVPIYYGPRLWDAESLPTEESLQTRVLSAHGIAAAWITLDRFGVRTRHEPRSPADPAFYLRRAGGRAAHLWRLFQSRREATVYMAEYYADDTQARAWAEGLAVDTWDDLMERHATRT
jgi:hypothetical protein